MKKINLKGGSEMPQFGLGTWRAPDTAQIQNAINSAMSIGYRHLDCSPLYGNEKAIGEALTSNYNQGNLKREDIWITSKLWNTEHQQDDVLPALKKTLSDLQTDYLDLYLIHWPIPTKRKDEYQHDGEQFYTQSERPLTAVWQKLIEAKEMGLVKNIGVSNFNQARIMQLVDDCGVYPSVNQIENHANLQQSKLVEFCNSNSIAVTAYCPLATGFPNYPSLLKSERIIELAASENCSPAQLLIAFQLKRGLIVIPKSVSKERQQENFEAQQLNLSNDTFNTLLNIDKNKRCIEAKFWLTEASPYSKDWLFEH